MTTVLLNKIKQMYSNVKVRIVRSDAEEKEDSLWPIDLRGDFKLHILNDEDLYEPSQIDSNPYPDFLELKQKHYRNGHIDEMPSVSDEIPRYAVAAFLHQHGFDIIQRIVKNIISNRDANYEGKERIHVGSDETVDVYVIVDIKRTSAGASYLDRGKLNYSTLVDASFNIVYNDQFRSKEFEKLEGYRKHFFFKEANFGQTLFLI